MKSVLKRRVFGARRFNMKRLRFYLQKFCILKKDDEFWKEYITTFNKNLRDKIIRETNWLAGSTHFGTEVHRLPFHDQAIKYFEYKNMIVQRRAQYVVIFLTIVLLIMTGFQIYLQFFNK